MDDGAPIPASHAREGQIPADHYWREDMLTAELDRVFKPSWLCVGFAGDLRNHNDFITHQVGPHSVVVQNFKGELKAFRNVCSHRFSRLQTADCGNRSLTCPYHGWRYDAQGVPRGIPHNETAFGFSEDDKTALALHGYAVDVAGNFVFVRMAPEGPSLRDFLGEVFGFLEHVSSVCSHRIELARNDVAANWKLCVENGVEAYHHPLVHADTFSNVLQQDIVMNTYGPHCTHEGMLTDASKHYWSVVTAKAKLKPSAEYRDYISFLIFPNIVTTFTAGALFTFQTLVPVAPGVTRITSSAWLAEGAGAAYGAVIPSLNAFADKVRGEDKTICEIAQTGVAERSLGRAAMLGEVDNRIRHFQQAYDRLMAQPGRAA